MKLFHLSDLHLGKRVNEFSMLEDQEYVLNKIIQMVDDEKPDAMLIAGDVYDKSTPPAEAVQLFDDFLYRLARRKLQVFIISGNHDSAERIAFGGRLMEQSGIHLSPVYAGKITPVTLQDEFGPVHIYMLPFIKPAHVRRYFPDETIDSWTAAIKTAVEAMDVDAGQRNVLVTHQFVTGAVRSESETPSVGGADNVDVSVFSDFDYAALGHIHKPQNIGGERARYCGSPLKYSFSEAGHEKSVTVAELGQKGELNVRVIPIKPMRELRELRGTYEELTLKSFYDGAPYTNEYLHITLTDEADIPDAAAKLRVIYPYLMKLDYDNKRSRAGLQDTGPDISGRKTPLELFAGLYERQNNQTMTKEQKDFAAELIFAVWEGLE